MIGDLILAHAGETASAKGTPNLGLVDTVVDWDGQSSMRVQELHSIFTVWHAAGQMPINDCTSSRG